MSQSVSTLPLDPVKAAVRQHWAARAATFDQGPSHGLLSDRQRVAWQARMRRWSGPTVIDVLDVGCGTGFLALLCAELGHRVRGVDVADEMLEMARTKAAAAGQACTFELADAEQLPVADASVDLVLERHLIWTLPAPEMALREWQRVLRPGGRLLLIEGDWRTPGRVAQPEYTAIVDRLPLYGGLPAADLRRMVVEQGYVDLSSEPLPDPDLWGGAPERERYAVHATRGSTT
jgi:ubiquinone/menaquinone biosynthesis C-methylase UbiE